MSDIVLAALAIGIFAVAGRVAWIRFRGKVIGEVTAQAQGHIFSKPGPRGILVKGNMARGGLRSVDLVFRGADKVATLGAEVVPKFVAALESAGTASGEARGLRGILYGTFTDVEVRALPTAYREWTVTLSFLAGQAEGPDIPVDYLLAPERAAELTNLLRASCRSGPLRAQVRHRP